MVCVLCVLCVVVVVLDTTITRQLSVNQPGNELATRGLNSEEEAEKCSKHTAKNPRHHHRCQQRGTREGCPVFQVRTARRKTSSRSINWALFSIQTEWRRNAIRIRVCRNEENVSNTSKSQSTRMNCIHCRTKHCTQENRISRKIQFSVLISNARTHGTRTARYKDN